MWARFTKRAFVAGAAVLCAGLMAAPSFAQTLKAVPNDTQNINSNGVLLESAPVIGLSAANPDYCINAMAGFPSDDHEARYQFFRLTEEMARDSAPEFRNALRQYGEGEVSPETPMLEAIEIIANPVLRQAAPELTIANMTYVIDFASICEPFITGQIESLKAFDSTLSNTEFNGVITEDALFLRQILSDSLYRLGADKDPIHQFALSDYANALILTRDAAEFEAFTSELEGLEALYMTDLDGRLKRSNDMINEEMDREVLGDSITLSDSLNEAEKKKAKERQFYTLYRILGGN